MSEVQFTDKNETPFSVGQIFKSLIESNGMKFVNQLHERSFSLNIFQMNGVALIESVLHASDPERGLELMSQENKEAGTQAHRELSRHLHNFTASAMTLVDHTRAFMKRTYAETSALEDYQAQAKQAFATDPVSQFVQGLRNYMVHKGLPDSEMFLEFKSGDGDSGALETGFRIGTESLLEWDKWKKPARDYLISCGKTLNIQRFVEEYVVRVNRFYDGLEADLRRFHAADLDELARLQALHQESLKQGEPTRSDEANMQLKLDAGRFEPLSEDEQYKNELHTYTTDPSLSAFSKIEEISFGSQRSGFPSEQHISATINDKDLIGAPVYRNLDKNGIPAIAFIFIDGKAFGFRGEKILEVEAVIDAALKSPWARKRLGRASIEKAFLDWSRSRYSQSTTMPFADALLVSAEREVKDLEVWLPIAYLEVEAPINFGPVKISPLTSRMVNDLEEKALAQNPEQANQISGLFQRIREEMQGRAAVVSHYKADIVLAEEQALLVARDVVDLLRFFSPGARSIFTLCPTALMGADHIAASKALFLRDGNLSSMTERVSSTDIVRWQMRTTDLPNLQKMGLSLAGRLVDMNSLSDFEISIRNSMITFSKGATLSNSMDRVSCVITAIEGVLLKHSMEPIEFNVAERMSFMLSREIGQRENIAQNVRQAYRLRTHHRARLPTPMEMDALATFVDNAYVVLLNALANIQNFGTRIDFVAALDSETSIS